MLVKALDFYSNCCLNKELDELNKEGGFFPYYLEETPIAEDQGDLAKKALKEWKEE